MWARGVVGQNLLIKNNGAASVETNCFLYFTSDLFVVIGKSLNHTLSIWLGTQFTNLDAMYIHLALQDPHTHGFQELIKNQFKVHSLLTYNGILSDLMIISILFIKMHRESCL